MAQTRDWKGMTDMSARLLHERTGQDLDTWNQRIKTEDFTDEQTLRAWLTEQGVTGYAQSLLVMERFGYPAFFLASADELIEGQYADRPQLRPIFDTIIDAAAGLGEVVVQTRKTYVSLVTPRRTFAMRSTARRSRAMSRRMRPPRTTRLQQCAGLICGCRTPGIWMCNPTPSPIRCCNGCVLPCATQRRNDDRATGAQQAERHGVLRPHV